MDKAARAALLTAKGTKKKRAGFDQGGYQDGPALPPRADDPSFYAATPKHKPYFGEFAAGMAAPHLQNAYNLASTATTMTPNQNSYVPEAVQRINHYLANMGLAGLSTVGAGIYGAAGAAGDVANAVGIPHADRLVNDLGAMADTAGALPEGRMIASLTQPAIAQGAEAVDAAQLAQYKRFMAANTPAQDVSAFTGRQFYSPNQNELMSMKSNPLTPEQAAYWQHLADSDRLLQQGASAQATADATGILRIPRVSMEGDVVGPHREHFGATPQEMAALRPDRANMPINRDIKPEEGNNYGYFDDTTGQEHVWINPGISKNAQKMTQDHEMIHVDEYTAGIPKGERGTAISTVTKNRLEALNSLAQRTRATSDPVEKARLSEQFTNLQKTSPKELYYRNNGELYANAAIGDQMAKRLTPLQTLNPYLNRNESLVNRAVGATSQALLGETTPLMSYLQRKGLLHGYADEGVHVGVPLDVSKAVIGMPPVAKNAGGAVGKSKGGALDNASENIADYVADLLRQGRAKEVTDDLMAQADPQRLHHHYTSGNTGMDLPMDQASRMARAAQMGYTNEEYRGVTGGGDRSAPRKRYDGERNNNLGFWTSNNPDVASSYAHPEAGSVYKFLTKEPQGGFPEVDVKGGEWHNIPKDFSIKKGGENIPLTEYAPLRWDEYASNHIVNGAIKRGDSGVKFKNMIDAGGYDHYDNGNGADIDPNSIAINQPSDIIARVDPSGIRSQFARFDPRLEHLAHLNASTGGAMDFARHVEAVQRAGGQIAPSKYLPNVPRQVHAGGGEVVNLGKEKLVRSIIKAASDVKSGAHQERMDQRAYKLHESGHLPLPIGTKVTPPQGWDMPSELHIHGYWQDILHPEQHGYKLKSENGDVYEVQHQMHSGQNPYVFGGGFKAYSGPVRNRAGYSDEAMASRNPILPTRTPEQSDQLNKEYDQLFGTEPDITKAGGGSVDFVKDNPGGDWLAKKQSYAFEYPRMKGIDGAITGWMGGKSDLFLPTHVLKSIEPLNNEKRVAGEPRFDDLMSSVSKEGFDPHQKGNKVVVAVNHRGKPFILEGNTRVAVAHAMGVPSVKAEVRYWNGAEEADGPMHPDKVSAMAAPNDPDITKADGGRVDDDRAAFLSGNHPDVPEVLYHGTAPRIAFKGGTNEVDEEQTQKNIAAQDFRAFMPSEHGSFGPGVYLTDDPEKASNYAQGTRAERPFGSVFKLHVSMKQPFTDDTLRHPKWKAFIKRALTRMPLPEGYEDDIAHRDAFLKALNNGNATVRDLFLRESRRGTIVNDFGQNEIHRTIRDSGFDGIIAHRHDGSKEYVAFKPEQVKSATGNQGTFDPNDPDMTKAAGGRVHANGGGKMDDEDDGITAYHGSAYDFPQFDINMLGKGTGHQAYGHGLYFAGDEHDAKMYRDMLKDSGSIDVEHESGKLGIPLDRQAQADLRNVSRNAGGDPIFAAKALQGRNPATRDLPQEKLADLIDRHRKSISGHMYKVKLNVKPEELLDWNKPLSEQHPNVQAALSRTMPKYITHNISGIPHAVVNNRMIEINPNGLTGRDAYVLSRMGKSAGESTTQQDAKLASEHLLSEGIKGIQYKQGGTHNYVMFHHDPVQVVDKYEYGGAIPKARDVSAALALTRRFSKDGAGATLALKPKGK